MLLEPILQALGETLTALPQQGSGTHNQGLAGPVGLQRAEGLNNVAVFYAIVVVT